MKQILIDAFHLLSNPPASAKGIAIIKHLNSKQHVALVKINLKYYYSLVAEYKKKYVSINNISQQRAQRQIWWP